MPAAARIVIRTFFSSAASLTLSFLLMAHHEVTGCPKVFSFMAILRRQRHQVHRDLASPRSVRR
jgi:hypothetical protein